MEMGLLNIYIQGIMVTMVWEDQLPTPGTTEQLGQEWLVQYSLGQAGWDHPGALGQLVTLAVEVKDNLQF